MAPTKAWKNEAGNEGWQGNEKVFGILPPSFRDKWGPLFLIVVCTMFPMVMAHCLKSCGGNIYTTWNEMSDQGQKGVMQTIYTVPVWLWNVMPGPFDPEAWKLIAGYAIFELTLMRILPGKEFRANVSATGHVPVYKANGMQAYITTLLVYVLLVNTGNFDSYKVYDKFEEIVCALAFGSWIFVLFLMLKGLYFPSTADSGTNGNIVKDFFWGTELYPRIFGWDIKVFTNCRFGMMYWAVGILSYAHHQIHYTGSLSDSMFVSVALQLVYIAKFFYWESGYMNTMDIQHDRAGFYICWGCLCWLPMIYTSASFFLTTHPVHMGMTKASTVLALGLFSIWANYDADRQRGHFRKVQGNCKIWGKPAEYVTATYVTGGETRTNLLLTSGWWGWSRHFHYVPEVMASFFWCVPALDSGVMPYFYVVYLMLLLTDRAYRDDARCSEKYGKHWAKYCEKVPKKIIPGLL